MAQKPSYGIDAPYAIRNLFLSGTAFIVIALISPRVTLMHITFVLFPGFLWPAASLFLGGILMLAYSLKGKFRHRDRILQKVRWTGAETVLDVGAGRGLLLIGAAQRLDTGRAIGIDIWNPEDLSGNGPDALLNNAALEGVSGKTRVESQDAREMNFPDCTFDVVLSNLCLHNIYDPAGRARACSEIARVLKPGGVAVISDYKLMREYDAELQRHGLMVHLCPLDWIGTFPPLRILVARKPA